MQEVTCTATFDEHCTHTHNGIAQFCKMVGEGSVASSWALPEGVDGSVVKMVSEAAREAVSKRRARLRAMLAAVDAPPSWE